MQFIDLSKQPEWIRAKAVAKLLSMDVEDIYSWKRKPEKFKVPAGLFHKFGKVLYINRDVLMKWFLTRNSQRSFSHERYE